MEATQTSTNNPRGRRLWLLLFLASALAIGSISWRGRTPANHLIAPRQRKSLPAIELSLIDHTRWRLSAHTGQIVLINYWATWCEPCQTEMPALNQIAREHAATGVALLGISLDEGPDAAARVQQFVAQFGIVYPVGIGQRTLNSASDVIGVPNTLLVDKHGRLAKIYAGPIRRTDVQDDLRALSREP